MPAAVWSHVDQIFSISGEETGEGEVGYQVSERIATDDCTHDICKCHHVSLAFSKTCSAHKSPAARKCFSVVESVSRFDNGTA